MQLLKKINQLIRLRSDYSKQNSIFWIGAFAGLVLLVSVVLFLTGYFFNTGIPKILTGMAMLALGLICLWLLRIIMALLHKSIFRIPTFVFSLVAAVFILLLLAKEVRFRLPDVVFYPVALITILCVVLFFGSAWILFKRSTNHYWFPGLSILISVALIGFVFYFFIQQGEDPYPIPFESSSAKLLSASGVNNPGEKGSYAFTYFTYGSGTDQQRPEFGKLANYKTYTVDASHMLPEWKGSKAKWRQRFWGFGVKEFPLNARVWIPEGNGKFPIIFIVHGNHGMEEFSDAGYAYLGELLASRGFIMVSVDENFLNATWSGDFMGREMPTRAWMLLKHIELWKTWKADTSKPPFAKADLDNIILAGHSRGGEAVPIAAHFNNLDYFPDDANVKFNFHFGIKGVIGIAPTDKRYNRRIKLENINYFSIQGSYDSDEASFFGLRQYQRIKFTDTAFHFKSGLYVHKANHGQFNSDWGRRDSGPPRSWLLNLKPMITQEEQQQIAKVYVSAFAEVVLHKEDRYLTLFKDAASGADWLSKAVLLNMYNDSQTQLMADFEEDIDLTSASAKEGGLQGEHLKVWREELLRFRDKDTQENNALVVGWDTSADSVKVTPRYRLLFQNTKPIDPNFSLTFSAAMGNPSVLNLNKENPVKEKTKKEEPVNFTIQLEDSLGRVAEIEINALKKITPRLKVQYEKLSWLQENYGDVWEPTLETFEIPLTLFKGSVPLSSIRHIDFIFNRTSSGVLILDDIGWRKTK